MSTSASILPDPGYFLLIGLTAAYACLAFIVLQSWLTSRAAAKERRRLAELHFAQAKAQLVRDQNAADGAAKPVTHDDLQALRSEMGTWTEMLSRTAKQARKSTLEREHLQLRVETLELALESLKSPVVPTFIAPAAESSTEFQSKRNQSALHLYDPVAAAAQDDAAYDDADDEIAAEAELEASLNGMIETELGLVYTDQPDQIDDLTQIWGIGAVNQTRLQENGVYCFHQIASWTPEVMEAFDGLLGFKGRIERESWVPQAERLMTSTSQRNAA